MNYLNALPKELAEQIKELYLQDDVDIFDVDAAQELCKKYPSYAESWVCLARLQYKSAPDEHDEYDEEDDEDDTDEEQDKDKDDEEELPVLRDPPFSAYPANRQVELLRRRGWFVATSPDYPPSRRLAINPRFRPSQVVSTVNNVADIGNRNNEDDDAVYSLSTVSFQDINQADLLRQEEHNDDQSSLSSVSTVDFNGVDFRPIIQDLRLIRQNGRIRLPNGTYHSIDSSFSFTPSEIRYTVTCYPGTFLRRYFRGPWPNFH